ncbi:MAG TPA: alanine racemase [Candidatus Acidoferrales bacterium]|nr:alanine racemase [Candidatus Acidoferrales bacterium]
MPLPVSTWVEVDLDRFHANLAAVRGLIGPGREILLVAKADAYGHGAREMAAAAEAAGVTQLGVATLHEGLQLRQSGCRLPIVALSPLLAAEIGDAVASGIDPTVGDEAFARALSAAAAAARRPVRFHVEIDTGMGRIGVREVDAERFLERVAALPGLRLASVYTHFPDADSGDLAFARGQVERFGALLARLRARGLAPPRAHAANSAGTVNLPEALFDWVRVGLVAYGVHPPHDLARPSVSPVLSLRTRLVQVRELPAGASISYGRTFTTSRPSRIGVMPVGYGHGYSWRLSNRGEVLIAGRRAPIVGRVTMDLTMIDVTGVPDVEVGDEVVLFGEQAGAAIPVEEFAAWSDTLPYEVMCTLGKRVPRLYARAGRAVRMTTLVGERPEWTAAADEYLRRRNAGAALGRA